MNFLRNSLVALALAAGAALLAQGCTSQIDEIDRTQVNRIKKADLRGVWYEIDVITDIPPTAAFGFAGQTNYGAEDSGRVIFDVQENHVVVYPYSEKAVGGDAKWTKRKIRKYWDKSIQDRADRKVKDSDFIEISTGNPVGIYPITSQFDILRDYSTTTGEQTNVLVENTSDKPWWQREYIRVDWGTNLITNLMFPQGTVKYSAVDYFVPSGEDGAADNPAQFYMAPDKDYFHFTRRLFGQPMSTGACSPYSLAPGDCSGAVVETRIAFRKVDVKRLHDYEIRQFRNNVEQDKFGFFLAERYRYDEEYGLIYTGRDSKAARWNLWQKSKTFAPVKDAQGKDIQCMTDNDCAKPAICDQKDFFEPGVCKSGARIPYSERGLRPIVYHLSVDHPENHLRGAYDSADGWSDVFKDTVSWLLFWEQKWKADKVDGFDKGVSKFGQRLCKTNADCAAVAALSMQVPTPYKANRVAVPISATDGVAIEECLQTIEGKADCADRDKLAGAAAVVFVNASPGTKLSLTGLPAGLTLNDIEYKNSIKDGKVSVLPASASRVIVPKNALATVDLTITGGSAPIAVPNVKIGADEVVFVVAVGGKTATVLQSVGSSKSGLRVVSGFDKAVEVGVNGVRQVEKLEFGRPSDYLFQVGEAAHIAFVEPGHRSDVTCATVQGTSQCVGWSQQISEADLKSREQIKASLPAMFVTCENQFTRSFDKCKADGQLGKTEFMNDCRYWVEDGKAYGRPGKRYNPCADKKDFGETPEAAKLKIQGDARYNYMYWVTKIHASSPLGYGPSAADPDTGEIFWAIANVYGASQNTYAQYGKDIVDLLNGDLDPKSLATGSYIKQYVLAQAKSKQDDGLFGAIADQLPQMTPEELDDAARNRATLSLKDQAAVKWTVKDQIDAQRETAEFSNPKRLNEWIDGHLPSVDIDALQARADKIKGTSLESAMITDEMMLVGSEGALQPGQAYGPEMMEKISPLGWATPRRTLDERKRMQFLGINSITMSEFQDPAMLGLAKRLKCDDGETPTEVYDGDLMGGKKCYKGDALRTALSVALYHATLAHEVGHTVGLRHNFSASTDAFNYFDQYYDEEKGGRTREFVACGDVTLPTGLVPGDAFCENQSFGEKCVMKACSKDADCPTGTTCGGNKQCLDSDGVQVGTCQSNVWQRTACADDSLCGGGKCVDGFCHDRLTCSANSNCSGGDICDGGYCVDARSAAPRTKLHYDEVSSEAKKLLSRAGLTQKEIDGRRTEFQYSSVMDYGQKINSDLWGLGKYDYAAIRYGYGEMVEVYKNPTYLTDRIKQYAKRAGTGIEQVSWNLETENWKDSIVPQFYYLNEFMPPEYNKQRYSVPEHFVQAERYFADNYFRGAADRTFFEVPYKYCSDEYRGGSMGCYYFDTGVNMEEIVFHAAEALEEYYIFDAFKRERLWFGRGGSPLSYMARIQDRWLTPITAAGRYYAIYNNIFRVRSWFPEWERQAQGFAPMRRASEASFRALTNMIATPAPGSYVFDKNSNSYVNVDYETGRPETQLDIPLGQGKFPWTTFATQKGYYMYDHPLWIGAYWDKVAAIMALTNSTIGLLSEYVGEQLPVFRATAIGYNTVYPNQLAQVLGGVAAGDITQFAGTVGKGQSGANAYKPFDPFRKVSTTDARVTPSVVNHSLRLFAAWQAIANLPAGFDPSYTDSMAVWLKGQGPQFTIGSGQVGTDKVSLEVCEFLDPFGQKTYVAPKPNYSVDRYSAAFSMCRKLNLLKTGCADGSQCQPCQVSDGACAAPGICGDKTACRGETWYTKASGAEKDKLLQQMKSEIEVLDYLRQLYSVYGNIGAGTN